MMKLQLQKQTKNNGLLTIKEISYNLAKDICVNNHYSKKWNTSFGKVNFGIFQGESDKCLGVIVFGNLMNPKSYTSISDELEKDGIIELNRMWLDDYLGKNAETTCLSMCFKYLKKYRPEIKVIQTFADGRLGCGTVYKASNFKYYGCHETQFFENIVTGEVMHKVPLENTKRLISMVAKNLVLANNKLKPFKVKTYRYLYILDKRLNKTIKLKELPYPEYNKGKEYNDHHHGIGNLARVWVALKLSDKFTYEQDLVEKYIIDNYSVFGDDLYDLAMNSKAMTEYIENEKEKTTKYLEDGLMDYIKKNKLYDSIYT